VQKRFHYRLKDDVLWALSSNLLEKCDEKNNGDINNTDYK